MVNISRQDVPCHDCVKPAGKFDTVATKLIVRSHPPCCTSTSDLEEYRIHSGILIIIGKAKNITDDDTLSPGQR